jgi:hypothetical protein
MKRKIFVTLSIFVVTLCAKEVVGQNVENRSMAIFPFVSSLNGRVGYLDSFGRQVIAPKFQRIPCSANAPPENCLSETLSAYRFSEGFAAVYIDNRYGYIDKKGEMKGAPRFDRAGRFSGGLAAVQIKGKYGYVDGSGAMVVNPIFVDAGDFSEGLAAVRTENLFGYIDRRNNQTIRAMFEEAGRFSEGLARVRVSGKYGYIDKKGTPVIPAQFSEAADFSQGFARVRIDGKIGYIDRQGKVAVSPQFSEGSDFAEGLALIEVGSQYGYTSNKGIRIGPKYFSAASFSDGLALVDGSIYIDTSGKEVLKVPGAGGYSFIDGLALIVFKRQAIPRKEVEPPRERFLGAQRADHVRYLETKILITYGYINKRGAVVYKGVVPVDGIIPQIAGPARDYYYESALVDIAINSNPDHAKVYLIPKAIWEDDESIINDDRLSSYELSTYTPYRNKVYSQVYIVVLEIGGKRVKKPLDANSSKDNTVDVDFDREN